MPVLDYKPRLDERNRAYRVSAADPALLRLARYWTPGYPVLDQQAEGACVGHGIVGEATASPVRVKPTEGPQAAAFTVYHRCLQIDEYEGERDEGTSVRAGMLVGRERGWWQGFRWAFNLLELRAALEEGPVVIGVEWRDSMYDSPDGVVLVDGDTVGGHCLLVTGYTPYHRLLRGPAYRLRNSWGADWGYNGMAYIHSADLNSVLFKAGGEAAVPVGRTL